MPGSPPHFTLWGVEKVNLGYSIKSIPTPTRKSYLLQPMEKIEMVIKRMRWKAIQFSNNENNDSKTKWYGLKSISSPRPVKELTPFENVLISLVKNMKFRKVRNHFQDRLQQDLRRMKASNKTMTFADKTRNIYRLTREEYDKILNDSITATYKKASNNIKKKINAAGKQVLINNKLLKRMQTNGENNCFISLKDHKENFQNNPTVRLINPAKNEFGKISKVILDRTNKNTRGNLQLNQWKNTSTIIDWLIKNYLHSFVIFDIKDFYPSIKELLIKAIKFSESFTDIPDEDKRTINHSRKSLLFNNQQAWIKKKVDYST